MLSILFFALSLAGVVKASDLAIRYSSKLTHIFRISAHAVGFIIVAGISILPETFITISSAFQGIPSFGIGTLFGGNVADLTLIFAILIFSTKGKIKISSKLLKTDMLFIAIMSIPILFGLNGYYSRIEGLTLLVIGILYYMHTLKNSRVDVDKNQESIRLSHLAYFILSIGLLLFSAHFTVKYGVEIANNFGIYPALIGMFVVALGTTLPELFFSLRAMRSKNTELALGDILGTVMADATIAVGITTLITPFSIAPQIIYVTGLFMLSAVFFLFAFMQSDKALTHKEGVMLVLLYVSYLVTELMVSR